MSLLRGYKPPLTDNESTNRAFQDFANILSEFEEGIGSGKINVYGVVGSGTGVSESSSSGLEARAGVTVNVYTYDPDNPTSPSDLLGTTTTDANGVWVLELTALGVTRPTFVSVTVGGDIKAENPIPVPGPFARLSGAWIPVNVMGLEVTVA